MVFKHIRNSKRYDGMNRLSKEYTTTNNKEKVKAQYTYGKTGGVTLVTNDTSAIANKYDNKGLVMEQKLFEDGKSYAMVYGNNANGKCVYSKIYNNNTGHYGDYDIQQMINYEYDAKGNMTTVSDSLNNSKVMARYTYDSNDNLSSVTYGNGTSTSYTYNKGNMIEKVINNNADNTQMSIYSYDYYLDGNVSQQNRNGVKCYYDYDEFSRIIDEDYGREEIDYYYDAAGNRTLKKICDDNGDTDVNYTYDLNNRLLEESTNYYSKNKTDVTKYVYDNNGNQIKKIGYITKGVNGSPSQDLVSENELNNTYEIYKYNEFNEMTSFESNKESKWEYAYLPNGLRYRKSNASHFDRYVWDRNGNIIAEMNGEGNLTNKYVRGNKLISKNGNEYFGYDGHGSVVNISNESGKSIKSYDYDAFGVELNKDANDTNLFRYCGEQYDNETDSIYLRARYYSPSVGRFTTEDMYWNSSNRIYGDKEYKDGEIKYPDITASLQAENLYVYCMGNPIKYIDKNGFTSEVEAEKIIKDNADTIIKAGEKFNVNPAIIAGCIYAEQTINVDVKDKYIDPLVYSYGIDVSLGIGQVRISTAKKVESKGYMPRIIVDDFGISNGEESIIVNQENNMRARALMNDKTNIMYVAAYLRYIQDIWKNKYPQISGKSDILGTLYNIGEYGKNGVNSNPQSNDFGKTVKKNYGKMQGLLGLK